MEALIAIGLIVAGIAVTVGIIGFLTGSWMLGSATFPALVILLVILGIFAVGRNAKHEDPNRELHDIE
jgi:membrane protein implicated in regulation of membrane protease activity